MIQQAERLQRSKLQFFAAANEKIQALKADGHDVIRLDIGSPDLPPADHIIRKLAESATKAENHGYQPHNGIPAYRQAWKYWYEKEYQVDLDQNREILPLLGSKEGIFHVMQAIVDPGDVVLIPDPGYLTYTQGTLINDGQPYFLPLDPANGYLPDIKAIPAEVADRAKILWLNYPNNPTAAVASLEFFEEVIEFARRYQILICHDAAYNHVTFDGYKAPSILQIPGATSVAVEFNTLSKSHNMAGWRIGAAIGNARILQYLYQLKSNVDSGGFLPILEAGTAALTGDQSWIYTRNEIYQKRRDIVVNALKRMGLVVETPKASIYVWSPIPVGMKSEQFTTNILEQAHVAVTPGTVFGECSEGFMRIALTDSTGRIQEAMQRIASFFS